MKIDTARDDWVTQMMQHYKPKERLGMEKGGKIMTKNVIIVKRKDIWQGIVGLKEEE